MVCGVYVSGRRIRAGGDSYGNFSTIATDAITINDSAPITFSALHQGNGLPEISGTARLSNQGQLEIAFTLRPGGNMDYEATITIDLSPCPCDETVSVLATDWTDLVCQCRGATYFSCSDGQCDQMTTCATGHRCKWTKIYAITV